MSSWLTYSLIILVTYIRNYLSFMIQVHKLFLMAIFSQAKKLALPSCSNAYRSQLIKSTPSIANLFSVCLFVLIYCNDRLVIQAPSFKRACYLVSISGLVQWDRKPFRPFSQTLIVGSSASTAQPDGTVKFNLRIISDTFRHLNNE